MSALIIITLIFLLFVYLIGARAHRRVKSESDFLLAGRQLSLFFSTATLFATWFGAGTLLTISDEVAKVGLVAAMLDPVGAGLCLLVFGAFYAAPLRQAGVFSIADFIGLKYGAISEKISAVLLLPVYFGWLAVQFVALALFLEALFHIPYQYGLLLVCIVGTGYTLIGGMWSVVLTDVFQVFFLLAGLAAVVVGLVSSYGVEVFTHVPSNRWDLWAHDGYHWLPLLLAGSLGNIPGQDICQRALAARSAHVAKQACLLAGVFYILAGVLPVMLGLLSPYVLAEDYESVVMKLAKTVLHPIPFSLFSVGVLAAVLSTIDSAMLSAATLISRNTVTLLKGPASITKQRWVVLLVALASLLVAYAGKSAYELLESAYEIPMVAVFFVFTFAIYKHKHSARAALTSMLVGFGVWLGCKVVGLEEVSLAWASCPSALFATALSLLAYLLVESLENRRTHALAGSR